MPATTAGLRHLHPDIISSHILTRLDGPDLASAASSSTLLRHISSSLWTNLCHHTWPSTASPLLANLIPTFPGGARAFFSQAYPTPPSNHHLLTQPPPPKLISAVDIHYNGKPILTKIQETETGTDWFRCSPFRVDLLVVEPKGSTTSSAIPRQVEGIELSWILLDPIGFRAVNLSSHKPVAAESHWLTGEVHVRFASILAVDRGKVQCGIVVTCGESESGEMEVREVSMEIEDLDGKHLNGRDSLVFLHAALEGKKGTGKNRVQESERRYKEYAEMKRERRERKVRIERVLDILLVAFGVSILVSLFCVLWCSR